MAITGSSPILDELNLRIVPHAYFLLVATILTVPYSESLKYIPSSNTLVLGWQANIPEHRGQSPTYAVNSPVRGSNSGTNQSEHSQHLEAMVEGRVAFGVSCKNDENYYVTYSVKE